MLENLTPEELELWDYAVRDSLKTMIANPVTSREYTPVQLARKAVEAADTVIEERRRRTPTPKTHPPSWSASAWP